MTLIWQNIEANQVKFYVLLVVSVIVFTIIGGIASYALNSIYFTKTEPYIYPCSSARSRETCRLDAGELDHGHSVLFYTWPVVNTTPLHYEPTRACVPSFLYHSDEK